MTWDPSEFEYWYDQQPRFGKQKREAWDALTSDQRKLWNERCYFRKFAKVAPIEIDPRTIESRFPPEADILCRISGKPHYFELGEVTDERLARTATTAARAGETIFGGSYLQLEPLCRIYAQKCSKSYETQGRELHLLLYYSTDHQVPHTEGLRAETLKRRDQIRRMLTKSPFTTAWLYDGWDDVVIDYVQR